METDFAFVSRLLEEAGIAYFFEYDPGDQNTPAKTKLVLADAPQRGDARAPIPFVDGNTHELRTEFTTKVKVLTESRRGHVSLRDHDFRLRSDYQLLQTFKDGVDRELKMERYDYDPGSYWVESTGEALPLADDKGIYKSLEAHGLRRATLALQSDRTGRRRVDFETNAIDLAPGKLFTIDRHPRADLASDKRLLVTKMSLRGDHDGKYEYRGEATFADDPYRPARATPRPRIHGVQSAIVVGPPGEEIHTDEFGRVRVQFHWDREHEFTDESSCWVRVSQGWAGLGYGMIALPRVGQEVLVEFFDGDPDRPVITGRVYNATSRVPYKLPDDKTKSGWRTDSSPGSNGFNELMFEDKKGSEEIHIQAERDFSEIIKHDQSSTVLNDRSASITSNDSATIGKSLTLQVGESSTHVVGENVSWDVGKLHVVSVENGTGITIRKDFIQLKTAGAAITLTENDIVIEAQGQLTVRGKDTTFLHSKKEIFIDAPMTYINTQEASEAAKPELEAVSAPAAPGSGGAINDSRYRPTGRGTVEQPGGYDEASPNAFIARPAATAADAPRTAALDAATAATVSDAVARGPSIGSLRDAAVSALSRSNIDGALKVLNVARSIKDIQATGGQSLLNIPGVKDAVGSIISQPILGDVTGNDIADILNAGDQLGIWHLGKNAKAATAFVQAAKPAQAAAAAGAAASGAAGAASAPQPGTSAASNIAEGIAQVMGVKTDAAPDRIDGDALTREILAGEASGMSTPKAQATALARQGVALYAGDFAGRFTKILPGG
jgi:type VI secretion system secreted protein VgrG